MVETAGAPAMFGSFWGEECDAIVYDEPLLEYNLHERTTLCADGSCEANGLITGRKRTQDPYGLVLAQGHPAKEALSVASISRVTAPDFGAHLLDKWFPGDEQEEQAGIDADDTAEVHFEWRFVVSCAAGSVLVLIGTYLHWFYYGWRTIKMRADVDEVPSDTHE